MPKLGLWFVVLRSAPLCRAWLGASSRSMFHNAETRPVVGCAVIGPAMLGLVLTFDVS